MQIKVLRNLYFSELKQAFRVGDTLELPAAVAAHWIETGAGEAVATPKPKKETAVLKKDRETR